MDVSLSELEELWWTGRPGVLWFMGLQRVRHDWATELKWTEWKGNNKILHLSSMFYPREIQSHKSYLLGRLEIIVTFSENEETEPMRITTYWRLHNEFWQSLCSFRHPISRGTFCKVRLWCPKTSLSSDYLLITDTANTVNGYVSNKNNELKEHIFRKKIVYMTYSGFIYTVLRNSSLINQVIYLWAAYNESLLEYILAYKKKLLMF